MDNKFYKVKIELDKHQAAKLYRALSGKDVPDNEIEPLYSFSEAGLTKLSLKIKTGFFKIKSSDLFVGTVYKFDGKNVFIKTSSTDTFEDLSTISLAIMALNETYGLDIQFHSNPIVSIIRSDTH